MAFDICETVGAGQGQRLGHLLAALEGAGKLCDAPRRLGQRIENQVDDVEQGFAAEKPDAGRIGPHDAAERAVP